MRIHAHSAVIALVAVLAGAAPLTPAPLAAQTTQKPIFLALPERFPDVGARVILLREPGREIVVLDTAAAGANELATGLRLLARLRRDRPEPPANRGQMIPIVGFAPDPDLTPRERTRLEAVLDELRARPIASVGTLGEGRWMAYDAGQ
jgi:hypothetical protein